ncbi:hypothetical protein BJF83_17175 [Nocardiopsis sp. CNR-923]|uniref:hypothetical protein n=1 Tax=Nocardiopsis sp. CNR-923 TaxID=1904965 RepID=UPI00095E49E9|nr:hypothetical protein [Nocardiopsis sp. CNR-923]OLT27823.1 hypothetical protein BJF83_17175 [Nocardiopsis sp. CNR-923]
MRDIRAITGKVLDFLSGLTVMAANALTNWVNRLIVRPFLRRLIRRSPRFRARLRARRAERGQARADVARDRAVERAGAYLQHARDQRALIIARVHTRVRGEVAAAKRQRDERIAAVKAQGGRLVAQAIRTGRKGVQQAEAQKMALMKAAKGKGPAAEHRAKAEGERTVRKAKLDSARRERLATQRADRIISNVRRTENANVQATIRRGTTDLRSVARQTDMLLRTAQDRHDRAVDAANAAHAAYTDQISERVRVLRALARDRRMPKAYVKEALRWNAQTARGQRQQFAGEIAAADPTSQNLPGASSSLGGATQNAQVGRAHVQRAPNGPTRLHGPGFPPRQRGGRTAPPVSTDRHLRGQQLAPQGTRRGLRP